VEQEQRSWKWYSIATGILVPATFIMSATMYDFATQTGHNHGLWQRISLTIGFGWFGLLAARLLRGRSLPETRSATPFADGAEVRPNAKHHWVW
jgi:hypothetical protein